MERTFADIDLFYFSSFIFKKYHGFIEKSNPSKKKNVTAKEELDCIYINDIVNSEDSPRLVFIDEKYRNLIVINDGGELTRNNQKKMQTFYIAWRCPPSDKSDVAGESIYSVTMWNIYCESVR